MPDPVVPPPPIKLTFFINHGLTNTGWSETHYINASSISSAQTMADNICTLRMTICNAKYSMVYARLSDMSIKGDGYPVVGTFPRPGVYVPTIGDGGQPGCCLLVRYTDGQGHRNMRFLHGIPEEEILDGQLNATTAYSGFIGAYYLELQTKTLFRRKKTTPPGVEFVAINGIFNRYATVKKVGRPFGLLRGRRVIG